MSTPSLVEIDGWHAAAVRGAAGLLGDVVDRLPRWRIRLEAIGRELQAPTAWSGPAAGSAAEVIVHLSILATAVGTAWEASLGAMRLLAGHVQAAHELAAEARSAAASIGAQLGPTGQLDVAVARPAPSMAADQFAVVAAASATAARATALAGEALTRAALASAAAGQAGEALQVVGVLGGRAPASFADLTATTVLPVRTPVAPSGALPAAIAAWWSALSAGAQLAAIRDGAATIGGLDGIPAWARDRANRLLLAHDLAAPGGAEQPMLIAVAGQLAAAEAAGRTAQLWEFDAGAGRAAVAIGDLDAADAVGVLVPGMGTTVTGDLGALMTSAEGVADSARAAAPGIAVATLAWIGYRAPRGFGAAIYRSSARRGAPALVDDLSALGAERAATGHSLPRTTVLAHSYGTVLVDQAADRPGRLATDAVVLMGSPGMEGGGDLRREVPEVYDAIGGLDPIGVSGWFGEQPWAPGYGATLLPTDWHEMHSDYYDPSHPTLAALGAVVAGEEPR